jgi:hypothetical protein
MSEPAPPDVVIAYAAQSLGLPAAPEIPYEQCLDNAVARADVPIKTSCF